MHTHIHTRIHIYIYIYIRLSFFFLTFNLSLSLYIYIYIYIAFYLSNRVGCPRCIMVEAMNNGIVISEFELQLRYHVHFRTNILGKCMNPRVLQFMD